MHIETKVLPSQKDIIDKYLKLANVPEDVFKTYNTYLRTLRSTGISHLAAGDILDQLDKLEKRTFQIAEFDYQGYQIEKRQQAQETKTEELRQSVEKLSTMDYPLGKRRPHRKIIY